MRGVVAAAERLDTVEAVQEILRVMAQPARIVEDDVLELRATRANLEELVDLLLVLDDGEVDLRIGQHVDHLLRDRVLIERDRHAAQRLCSGHRPVEPRAVVADDREIHPPPEALRCKAARERAHFLRHLRPGPGLPDTEVLFARGRAAASDLGMMQQQPGKRVERRRCGSGGRHVAPPRWGGL